jgi:hypothetical protein
MALAAKATADARVHATYAGSSVCLCGAPIARTVPGTFATRDPQSCPICALALVMQQNGQEPEGS